MSDEPNYDEDADDKPKTSGSLRLERSRELKLKQILAEQGREITGPELDVADFPQVCFQLANGHAARVILTPFEVYHDYGINRAQFYSVKILSSDGMVMGEMVEHYDFRIPRAEALAVIPPLWKWLDELIATPRRIAEYDEIDEFIEDMAEQIELLPVAGKDAVDHLSHFPDATPLDESDPEGEQTS